MPKIVSEYLVKLLTTVEVDALLYETYCYVEA